MSDRHYIESEVTGSPLTLASCKERVCSRVILTIYSYQQEMVEYLDQEKYRDSFDPKVYLASDYCDPVANSSDIQLQINFYAAFPDDSLTILEYSGGPSLMDMIIAAPKASKIIFSDYAKSNRDEIKRWLDKDPGAFDWTPTVQHVLELEGKATDTTAVQNREECLRRSIKAVIHCDLAADPIVEKEYEGPYDIVNASGVLDVICKTKKQYIGGMKKLSALVNKGGYLLLAGNTEDDETYTAGATFSTPLDVTEDDIKEAFIAAGLSCEICEANDESETILAFARKN